MNRVVKVIGPLCIQAVTMRFARHDQTWIVEFAFGNQYFVFAKPRAQVIHFRRQLFQEIDG